MTIAEKIVAEKDKISLLIIIIKKENENRAIFKGTIEQFTKNTKIIQ